MRARTVDARTKKKTKETDAETRRYRPRPLTNGQQVTSYALRHVLTQLLDDVDVDFVFTLSDSSISVQTGFRCVRPTWCVHVACAVWRSEVDDDRPPDRGGHRDRSLASFSVVVAALLFSSDALLLLVLVLLHGVDAVDVG